MSRRGHEAVVETLCFLIRVLVTGERSVCDFILSCLLNKTALSVRVAQFNGETLPLGQRANGRPHTRPQTPFSSPSVKAFLPQGEPQSVPLLNFSMPNQRPQSRKPNWTYNSRHALLECWCLSKKFHYVLNKTQESKKPPLPSGAHLHRGFFSNNALNGQL